MNIAWRSILCFQFAILWIAILAGMAVVFVTAFVHTRLVSDSFISYTTSSVMHVHVIYANNQHTKSHVLPSFHASDHLANPLSTPTCCPCTHLQISYAFKNPSFAGVTGFGNNYAEFHVEIQSRWQNQKLVGQITREFRTLSYKKWNRFQFSFALSSSRSRSVVAPMDQTTGSRSQRMILCLSAVALGG